MTLLADLIKKRESRAVATATFATPATKPTFVATVATVARAKPQTDQTPEPAKDEKLHELSLLIEYVAANEGFTEQDRIEAKHYANKDVENALISFRALAKTIRRDRAIELLQATPESLRAVFIDEESDPNNVILAIAVRHVAVAEMVISKSKYDPWQLMSVLDAEVH